jgi:hypothetical protein
VFLSNVYINLSEVSVVVSTKGAHMEWKHGSCGRDKEYLQNFCGFSPGIPPHELQDEEAYVTLRYIFGRQVLRFGAVWKWLPLTLAILKLWVSLQLCYVCHYERS